MPTTVKIDFVTAERTDYYRSHLTAPRGYGAWSFEVTFYAERDFDGTDSASFEYAETYHSPAMSFTEARKWAREEVRRAIRLAPADVVVCEAIIDTLA